MLKKIYKISTWGVAVLLGGFGMLLASTAINFDGGFKALTVLSGSMEPAVKTWSMVFVRQASEYRVGDIITFGAESKSELPTTHRIIKEIEKLKDGKMEKFYATKGDKNDAEDGNLVSKADVRGKVYFSVPYLGYMVHKSREPKWFFVFIILPASALIYSEILNIIREFKRVLAKRCPVSPYVLDLRYIKIYE